VVGLLFLVLFARVLWCVSTQSSVKFHVAGIVSSAGERNFGRREHRLSPSCNLTDKNKYMEYVTREICPMVVQVDCACLYVCDDEQ